MLKIPLILLSAIVNAIICTVVCQRLLMYLNDLGVERHINLIITILCAVCLYAYIIYNSKLRDFTKGK